MVKPEGGIPGVTSPTPTPGLAAVRSVCTERSLRCSAVAEPVSEPSRAPPPGRPQGADPAGDPRRRPRPGRRGEPGDRVAAAGGQGGGHRADGVLPALRLARRARPRPGRPVVRVAARDAARRTARRDRAAGRDHRLGRRAGRSTSTSGGSTSGSSPGSGSSGPPVVRDAIRHELELFERELATDLARLPNADAWSSDDLRIMANLIVTAMVVDRRGDHLRATADAPTSSARSCAPPCSSCG